MILETLIFTLYMSIFQCYTLHPFIFTFKHNRKYRIYTYTPQLLFILQTYT
ncbi:hypothetical protein Hanom_Chr16g01511701 [Helianthus anomalus]